MNNLFYNNALLSKLCCLLDELSDNEDKGIIAKMITKQMPTNTQYNFSLEELSSVTKEESGRHAYGVRKSKNFAKAYLYSLYNIDFQFEYMYDKILDQFIDEKYYNTLEKMTDDFQITRALIYKTIPVEIKAESTESFDLYVTNIFIEQYLKIKDHYNLMIAEEA